MIAFIVLSSIVLVIFTIYKNRWNFYDWDHGIGKISYETDYYENTITKKELKLRCTHCNFNMIMPLDILKTELRRELKAEVVIRTCGKCEFDVWKTISSYKEVKEIRQDLASRIDF